MNRVTRYISIRYKLIIIIMSVSFLSALMVFLLFSYRHIQSNRDIIIQQTRHEAMLIGNLLVPDILDNNKSNSSAFLSNLKIDHNVKLCIVFDKNGVEFSRFGNIGSYQINQDLHVGKKLVKTVGGRLHVMAPIQADGANIGAVYIIKEIAPMMDQIYQNLITMALFLTFLLTLSLAVAIRLQKVISVPISHLKTAVEELSLNSNYDISLTKQRHDEIGALFDGFNEMVLELKNRQIRQNEMRNALLVSKNRYQLLFERSPVALLEEDLTGLMEEISAIKESGVTNIKKYFADHPEKVLICTGKIIVLNINKTAMDIFGIDKKEDILGPLSNNMNLEFMHFSVDHLDLIASNRQSFDYETTANTKNSDVEYIHFWFNAGETENGQTDYSKVIIAASDITSRKNIEISERKKRIDLERSTEEITQNLKRKNKWLERYTKLFIGREHRIRELRDELKNLKSKLNELS